MQLGVQAMAVGAEIGQLDRLQTPVQQHIGRLQVEIAPAILVHLGQRLIDLADPAQQAGQRHGLLTGFLRLHMPAQIRGQQFQRQYRQALMPATVEQADDVALIPWL
jgi:hypothetical protein